MFETELDREFRLAKQTVAMHYALRDRYLARSLAAELVLLVGSAVFCATTFSPDELFSSIGLPPGGVRLALRVASVAAFAASLVLLVIDWKGAAARHGDSAGKWSVVVARFREHRTDGGAWPEGVTGELHRAYWNAAQNSIAVPDKAFNSLKARYLMKVELSRRLQEQPGAPRALLWLMIRLSGTARAIKREIGRDREGGRDGSGTERKSS